MECCAVVFSDDTVPFLPRGRRWELDPQARTIVGRDRHFSPDGRVIADLPVRAMGTSRSHCCMGVVDGHWLIEDLESTGGTFVNGRRIGARRPLTHGDRMDIPCVARFERFRRTRLLEDLIVAGPWTLYGLDRPLGPGVWPALRFDDGVVVRGTAIVRAPVRPLRPAIVPDAREIVGPWVVDVHPGVGGVPLAALPQLDRLDPAVAALILDDVTKRTVDGAEILVDFDGRVHAIPAMRNHAVDPLPILRDQVPSADHLASRTDLAGTIRGLCPDAWTLEEQLRDELAALSPDTLRSWREAVRT